MGIHIYGIILIIIIIFYFHNIVESVLGSWVDMHTSIFSISTISLKLYNYYEAKTQLCVNISLLFTSSVTVHI